MPRRNRVLKIGIAENSPLPAIEGDTHRTDHRSPQSDAQQILEGRWIPALYDLQ